ncbi:MAG: Na+/H+ antiporter subunit A [Microbacteriaceae bacterium]|nr:Na+/H+ antiporter subunit A [Microbacteriaceae bacterium]
MLTILAVFGIMSIAMPLLRRLPGNLFFYLAAAVSAGAAAWLVSIAPTVFDGGVHLESHTWVEQIGMQLDFRIDALSWVLAMIVTVIGALVLVYCAGYFTDTEASTGRFGGVLLAFAGVMLGLVTADNIYLMFIFWEATSILSYLLIGHYSGRRASRGAAMQALLVTTLGGLTMLVGLVMLHIGAGSAKLSEIVVAGLQPNGYVITAALLVLVGAATKSALVPFHFWLPGAMAAPTPVSAYLHAASMVKAGIYLVLRMVPGFHDIPGFRETLIVAGVVTMLVGGWRSLRQYDLKLVLAYGTVSQLGFIMVIAGYGTRDAALAALAMVLSHAMFKGALFLVVGIIDHCAGTRDIRKLSGLGRRAPVLATTATIAAASMAGLPPTWGFVAKESALAAFLQGVEHGDAWGWVALVGVVAGSALTVAYTLRFLHGAFARKPELDVEETRPDRRSAVEMLAPIVLVLATLVLAFATGPVDGLLAHFADAVPSLAPEHPAHLALWHGFTTALVLSLATLVVGALLFAARGPVAALQERVPAWIDSSRGYWTTMRVVDWLAARITATTQRGSLPFYLSTILIVVASLLVFAFIGMRSAEIVVEPLVSWQNAAIVGMMALAAIAAANSHKRFQGLVLVGITGYGMAGIFALAGAPDLATTQALIETITLVVFVLVLRRLPAHHAELDNNLPKWLRWTIGWAVGLGIGGALVVALAGRVAPSDGLAFPELAVTGGHGENFVNVTLVDIRGWDTMGELLVLVAAATGVASLVYLRTRGSVRERRHVKPREDGRRVWLLAGHSVDPEHRSIVVEVIVRLIFHALLITSLFLLFSGHNDPGGGFAGGVVAGLALAARYIAGGRKELDAAVRIDAGWLLGLGVLIVGAAVVGPMLVGHAPFTSFWIDERLPVIGHFIFVTSTIFDVGVYLIVIGLVIDILRSLGSELDEQAEEEDLLSKDVGAMVLDEAEVRGERRGEPAMPVTRQIQIIGRQQLKRAEKARKQDEKRKQRLERKGRGE